VRKHSIKPKQSGNLNITQILVGETP